MCVYIFKYCDTAVNEVSAFTNVLKEETNNKPVNIYEPRSYRENPVGEMVRGRRGTKVWRVRDESRARGQQHTPFLCFLWEGFSRSPPGLLRHPFCFPRMWSEVAGWRLNPAWTMPLLGKLTPLGRVNPPLGRVKMLSTGVGVVHRTGVSFSFLLHADSGLQTQNFPAGRL